MANRMKSYQRNAEAYERRWKTASEQGNTSEMYTAVQDYDKNIKVQEEELKNIDPNSKDYEKAQRAIAEQKSTKFEMEYAQRRQVSGESKKEAYEQLEAKNTQLSHDMSKAVERGDTATYESLRSQYEKNISTQDSLGREMREENIQYNDTGRQSKQDIYCHDCDMRDKFNEKVAERESRGKEVKTEDRTTAEKYSLQVKKDEQDMIKYNGDRTIESMRELGASESEIKSQEEQNKQNQDWIKRNQ